MYFRAPVGLTRVAVEDKEVTAVEWISVELMASIYEPHPEPTRTVALDRHTLRLSGFRTPRGALFSS